MLTDEGKANLVHIAKQARQHAYAPYSHYAVGVALLTASGKIYSGVNIENATYSATVCAERVAIFNAISEGERDFIALAVVTRNAGTPCGTCRQVLAEFGMETLVLIADTRGNVAQTLTVADLLPGAFTPDYLRPDET